MSKWKFKKNRKILPEVECLTLLTVDKNCLTVYAYCGILIVVNSGDAVNDLVSRDRLARIGFGGIGVDDFINKIKGEKFRTALDVLDVIRLCFGEYKWHNNSDGTLTVKVKDGVYHIRFIYEPLKNGINERVAIINITEEDK